MFKQSFFLIRFFNILSIGFIYKQLWGNDEGFLYVTKHLAKMNIFILKLLQGLSTNSVLLTKKQNDILLQYTDNVPYSQDDIEDDFIKYIDILSDKKIKINDNTPIQSGAIALVYKGMYNDKEIVIKVQRKDMRNKIEEAINHLYFIAKIVNTFSLLPALNLNLLINENKEIMLNQTDFIKEVENMTRMKKNCNNIDYLKIPTVYPEFTTKNNNIIVMEFIEGRKLQELADEEKDDYAFLLAKFGIFSFLYNRFYHSDLHAGNILFLKNGEQLQLGILDFGIMGELTKEEQCIFHDFVNSIGKKKNDLKKSANIIMNSFIESIPNKQNTNEIHNSVIEKEIHLLLTTKMNKNNNFNSNDLYEINKILYQYNLQLSRTFCKVILAFAISDNVCQEVTHHISYLEHLEKATNEIFDMSIMEY